MRGAFFAGGAVGVDEGTADANTRTGVLASKRELFESFIIFFLPQNSIQFNIGFNGFLFLKTNSEMVLRPEARST